MVVTSQPQLHTKRAVFAAWFQYMQKWNVNVCVSHQTPISKEEHVCIPCNEPFDALQFSLQFISFEVNSLFLLLSQRREHPDKSGFEVCDEEGVSQQREFHCASHRHPPDWWKVPGCRAAGCLRAQAVWSFSVRGGPPLPQVLHKPSCVFNTPQTTDYFFKAAQQAAALGQAVWCSL